MTLPDGRPIAGPPLGDREFPFTADDFNRIAAMLHADAGITLSETKAALVYARLVKRLRALGIENFKRYCELVSSRSGTGERRQMTAALTTNVTRFFREPHHFEHLKTEVLPRVLPEVRRGGRLRIWSAGCSSGEEPYSIALTVLEAMPDAAEFDVRILATDISTEMIPRGVEGAYSDAALAPVPRAQRSRWFVREADGGEDGERPWLVGDALRSLVSFRLLNLTGPWPMRASYQAIFCRNVLIYFDAPTRTQVWRRMEPLLAADGRLYVGHSERVIGMSEAMRFESLTTYRRSTAPDGGGA